MLLLLALSCATEVAPPPPPPAPVFPEEAPEPPEPEPPANAISAQLYGHPSSKDHCSTNVAEVLFVSDKFRYFHEDYALPEAPGLPRALADQLKRRATDIHAANVLCNTEGKGIALFAHPALPAVWTMAVAMEVASAGFDPVFLMAEGAPPLIDLALTEQQRPFTVVVTPDQTTGHQVGNRPSPLAQAVQSTQAREVGCLAAAATSDVSTQQLFDALARASSLEPAHVILARIDDRAPDRPSELGPPPTPLSGYRIHAPTFVTDHTPHPCVGIRVEPRD